MPRSKNLTVRRNRNIERSPSRSPSPHRDWEDIYQKKN